MRRSTLVSATCAAMVILLWQARGRRFLVMIVKARLPRVVVQLFPSCPTPWVCMSAVIIWVSPGWAFPDSAMRLASAMVLPVEAKWVNMASSVPNSQG